MVNAICNENINLENEIEFVEYFFTLELPFSKKMNIKNSLILSISNMIFGIIMLRIILLIHEKYKFIGLIFFICYSIIYSALFTILRLLLLNPEFKFIKHFFIKNYILNFFFFFIFFSIGLLINPYVLFKFELMKKSFPHQYYEKFFSFLNMGDYNLNKIMFIYLSISIFLISFVQDLLLKNIYLLLSLFLLTVFFYFIILIEYNNSSIKDIAVSYLDTSTIDT